MAAAEEMVVRKNTQGGEVGWLVGWWSDAKDFCGIPAILGVGDAGGEDMVVRKAQRIWLVGGQISADLEADFSGVLPKTSEHVVTARVEKPGKKSRGVQLAICT